MFHWTQIVHSDDYLSWHIQSEYKHSLKENCFAENESKSLDTHFWYHYWVNQVFLSHYLKQPDWKPNIFKSFLM